MPFRAQPKAELLAQAAAWRLLDLSSSNGQPIDLLIATRFPTYFARHPRKVAWVIHQHRAAYELCGTPYSDFEHTEADVGLRQRLIELDAADARRVPSRVHQRAEHRRPPARRSTASPPSRCTIRRRWPSGCAWGRYGDYVLVGRPARNGEARRTSRSAPSRTCPRRLRLVIVGEGSQRAAAEQRRGGGRRRRPRRVCRRASSDDELVELYADALAVVYAPFDEDYGYVTLEAFLCAQAGDHGLRLGRHARVRRRRRERTRVRTRADSHRRAPWRAWPPIGSSPRGSATPGRRARVTITWDGVVEQLLG